MSDFSTGAVWAQSGGTLLKVAIDGDSAPGTVDSNRTYNGFSFTGFDNSGRSAFHAFMPPTGSLPGNFPSSGLWSGPTGSLAKIAEQNDAAPGISSGLFSTFSVPSINNKGAVAFVGDARVPAVSSGQGVWYNAPGSLTKVASYNDLAPGTATTFSNIFNPLAEINDAGDVAFSAELNGGSIPFGLWVLRAGETDKIMVEGEAAPGTGANFQHLDTLFSLATNGSVVFTAQLDDGRRGLFADTSGSVLPVALAGDTAPDSGGSTFQNIVRWTANDQGKVAFLADLSDFSSAIYAQDSSGVLYRVVGNGDSIEVAPGDFRQVESLSFFGLDGSDSSYGNGQSSGFNDAGQVAFEAVFNDLDGTSGVFVTSVPEPASLFLLAIGGALLAVRRWWRTI